MSLIKRIGIVNILNLILVKENVRPAMLVQPQDYGEATGKDNKTKSILEAIKEHFPELLQSDDYEEYQGIIISRTNYNGEEISLERMGQILGYPCYKDFNNINPDLTSYSIDIYVHLNNGKQIQLFANVCKDENAIDNFKTIVENAKMIFRDVKYSAMLDGIIINDVVLEIETIVPTGIIIDKLIGNKKKLDQNEINKIQNILFNFGFSMEIQLYFLENFQYNNPLHVGILLDLLIREKNDTLTPFTPLQQYPIQDKEVYTITKKWETDLLDILERTKLPLRKLRSLSKTRTKKWSSRKGYSI
jgi:hypothetical protein